MTIKTSTLRPGLLVSLKTSLTGNVKYDKRTIEAERVTSSGAAKAKWETVRTIGDPKEHERATQARSKASVLVRMVCARSAFGLLCPQSAERELEAAIEKARQVADDFNRTAKRSRVSVYVITGRIAADDVEAMRAINSEVRELLEDMKRGVKNLDAKAVREAANKARNIGSMLSPAAAERMNAAISAARGAARQIVKAGETVGFAIDRQSLKAITDARTTFLDLDAAKEIAAPKTKSRALDLAPSSVVTSKRPKASARAIELE